MMRSFADALPPAPNPAFEPYKVKAVEPIRLTTPEERRDALERSGYNLFRIPADLVAIDLLTDSGVTAMSARQWGALLDGDEAYAGSRSFARFESVVRSITGMPHVIPTHQGRAAERLLFQVMLSPGETVPGNTHFDTTHANIEARGTTAIDLPSPATHDHAAEHPFKGDIDLEALEDLLTGDARVPLVIITVTNNSAGGQPVSMANLEAASALCHAHGVPLFLDGARFAENSWLIREREAEWHGRPPLEIARAMFDLADGCLVSAKKDGLVNIGGFLAVRDDAVAEDVRRLMVLGEGFPTYGGLAGRDLEAMASGLEEVLDPAYLADRINQVRTLGDTLTAAGVPIVRPPGGHAVYIDGRAFLPHLDPLDYPAQALSCALYLHAGVRSVEVGQLMNGRPGPGDVEVPVEHDLLRLAIPRRVYTSRQLGFVADALADLHRARAAIGPLEITDQPAALRHFGATLRPRVNARPERTSAAPSVSS